MKTICWTEKSFNQDNTDSNLLSSRFSTRTILPKFGDSVMLCQNITRIFSNMLLSYEVIWLLFLLGTSGRSQAAHTSTMSKRRKTVEMREKVKSQGAFSVRAHERTPDVAGKRNPLEVCFTLRAEALRFS